MMKWKWEWQAIDGANLKAPIGKEEVGPNPTDRGKKWIKASPFSRRTWRPALHRHDVAKLADVLDGKIVEPPQDWEGKQNLCADAGYIGKQHHKTIINHGYIAHVRPRGEEAQEKDKNLLYKPLRWIVEVSHSWFNRFKKNSKNVSKKESVKS